MARYIDADKVMEEINRMGGHNLCEWETIGVKALIDRQPTADVVPKSEVEELKAIIKDHQANEERWQELYADTVNKWEKAYEELEIQLEKAKQEVAREIFEEIEGLITNQCLILKDERGLEGYVKASVHYALAELKKKYTESETILGECKFTEQISQEQPDLSDAKFIDEDGNVIEPSWNNWDVGSEDKV